jgi:hypothetical protein
MLSATAFNAFEVGGAFGGYANHDDSGSSPSCGYGLCLSCPLPAGCASP